MLLTLAGGQERSSGLVDGNNGTGNEQKPTRQVNSQQSGLAPLMVTTGQVNSNKLLRRLRLEISAQRDG